MVHENIKIKYSFTTHLGILRRKAFHALWVVYKPRRPLLMFALTSVHFKAVHWTTKRTLDLFCAISCKNYFLSFKIFKCTTQKWKFRTRLNRQERINEHTLALKFSNLNLIRCVLLKNLQIIFSPNVFI